MRLNRCEAYEASRASFRASSSSIVCSRSPASLGYRFEEFTVAVLGSNLNDRRDALQLSELGEEQFYRLPARRVDATVTWHYK